MGYFKLDKIDKIVISFILIIVTMFSIFNCFCFAIEGNIVNYNIIPNLDILGDDVYQNDDFYIKYWTIYLNPENDYFVLRNFSTGGRVLRLTSSVPSIGTLDVLENLTVRHNDNTNEYVLDLSSYVGQYDVLFLSYNVPRNDVDNYFNMDLYSSLSSLSNSLYILGTTIGVSDIWNVFEKSIPYLLVVVLISLGVWFIRHNIIEHSKGRDF